MKTLCSALWNRHPSRFLPLCGYLLFVSFLPGLGAVWISESKNMINAEFHGFIKRYSVELPGEGLCCISIRPRQRLLDFGPLAIFDISGRPRVPRWNLPY